VPAVAELEAAAAEATVPHPVESVEQHPEPQPQAPVEPPPPHDAAPEAPAVPVEAAPPASREPLIGPAVLPIVLGTPEAAVTEKKRGWWRK
jgi:hypothetical protein